MLAKLRRKFILINMTMVSVVVIVALCAIAVAAWHQSETEVYEALDASLNSATQRHDGFRLDGSLMSSLLDGSALFSGNPQGENPLGSSDESTGNTSDNGSNGSSNDASTQDSPSVPQLGANQSSIPVAVYQITDGQYALLVSRVTTASLDDTLLQSALSEVTNATSDRGLLDSAGLYYATRTSFGETYVAFADTSSASNWKNLVLALVGIGVLTLIVFFVISLFFSRWALKPVEEAWGQQKQFIADASHELKTPLTVILANMSIMLKHSDMSVQSQAQWVESTQHEAESMQEMVTDMLDLARAEDDGTKDAFEPVDFSDLTEGSLLQFESVAFERNVLIDDTIQPGLTVQGNRSQLERLSVILLDNACKYAQPGSSVTVLLQEGTTDKLKNLPHASYPQPLPSGRCAILQVSNLSTPVDPEDLPHLFDRFYRSDKARTRTEGSYGLGLAIAAQIAQTHKGAIMVQSIPEGATTFTVALPL